MATVYIYLHLDKLSLSFFLSLSFETSWIIDDSRSRTDRDRRSLQDFTDDPKSRTEGDPPVESTSTERSVANQIKPEIIANSFLVNGFSDYRSLPTIISCDVDLPRSRNACRRRNCDTMLILGTHARERYKVRDTQKQFSSTTNRE